MLTWVPITALFCVSAGPCGQLHVHFVCGVCVCVHARTPTGNKCSASLGAGPGDTGSAAALHLSL